MYHKREKEDISDMGCSNESLKIIVTLQEQQRICDLIKSIVTELKYTQDWTYAANNIKNESFREKYICGEDEYKSVLSKLNPAVFLEAEKNNSKKVKINADAAKEVMYKFIVREMFVLKYPEDIEEELVNIYVKVTFPGGIEESMIIVSFHESLRSLEDELENKIRIIGQQ